MRTIYPLCPGFNTARHDELVADLFVLGEA